MLKLKMYFEEIESIYNSNKTIPKKLGRKEGRKEDVSTWNRTHVLIYIYLILIYVTIFHSILFILLIFKIFF